MALSVLVRDRRRYERDQADRDIRQARGVLTAVTRDEPTAHRWTVAVTNYSAHVLTNLHVTPPTNLGDPAVSLASIDPRQEQGWSVFEAGAVENLNYLAMRTDSEAMSITVSRHEFNPGPAIVTFTDAAGLRWRRQGIEQPERVIGRESDGSTS